jgi:hypothetical protein
VREGRERGLGLWDGALGAVVSACAAVGCADDDANRIADSEANGR